MAKKKGAAPKAKGKSTKAKSVSGKSAKTKTSKAITGTQKKLAAGKKSGGAPINEQDPKRRLGNFGGAGEHPLQGGRTTGIVGQTKQQNKTDQKSKKK